VTLHPNAKTTPFARELLTRRVAELGWSMDDAAQAAGISPRTGYRWMARQRAEGREGLRDRRSTPHRMPRRTGPGRARRIEALRRKRLTGMEIARRLAMPRSTVAAVLTRLGLARLSSLDPKPPVHRYEREHPGELVHLDVKKLGRFREAGHRVTGHRRQDRSRGIGWEFVHVCIDDRSRVAYVEILPDEKGASVEAFTRRALRWFHKRGVRVQRILTDNGSGYLSRRFRALCEQMRVRHLRTQPYRPRTNGKAERFIQTVLREWAYARPYRTSNQRARRLPAWLDHYNRRRPHSALGYRPPMSRIRRSR
jgi:transposase InsO family protein